MVGKQVKFVDAVQGIISISENKHKYFKTKDSTSPSGHSLIAQIQMTHSGIVTRNYGFYLPSNMKAGAPSFTKDFAKPVLIGHDENGDTKPVGRVIQADYIDTSSAFRAKDSYFADLLKFTDAKAKKTQDFVNYVISNYDGKDGYKGLGHILGTLKISDAETIEAMLDERYLTVSTSMTSPSAVCNICNTDWVSEGMCDHHRGHKYDDNICVLVPGAMRYDHLGIVNTPADPHAHKFTLVNGQDLTKINNSAAEEELYKTRDAYEIAAHLFAYSDNVLIPLSSENEINLIEIKDNIQKMEQAMKINDQAGTAPTVTETAPVVTTQDAVTQEKTEKPLVEQIRDALSVSMNIYSYNSEEGTSKSVSVSEYVKELDPEAMSKMCEQMCEMMGCECEKEESETPETSEGQDMGHILTSNGMPDKIQEVIKKYFDSKQPANKAESQKTGNVPTQKENKPVTKEKNQPVTKEKKPKTKKKVKTKYDESKNFDGYKLAEGAEITDEDFNTNLTKILEVTDSALTPEQSEDLAEMVCLYAMGDAILTTVFDWSKKTTQEIIADYKVWSESLIKYTDATAEIIYAAMTKYLPAEKVLTKEQLDALKTGDFCGAKGFFPVVDAEHAKAAFKVLGHCITSDSIKERIFTSINKKIKKLGLTLTESFDSQDKACDNNQVKPEELLNTYNDLRKQLMELGHKFPDEVREVTVEVVKEVIKDQDLAQELKILESQLDAANEEVHTLSQELELIKKELCEELAGKIVEDKITLGEFKIDDKASKVAELKERNLTSLKDTLKDLEQVKASKRANNDGVANTPSEKVKDPTLKPREEVKDNNKKEEEKFKIYDQYNQLVTRFGKKYADAWLNKVKPGDRIPTLD